MSQEIIEGIQAIEKEKGIEEGVAHHRARGCAPRCVQEDAGRDATRRGRSSTAPESSACSGSRFPRTSRPAARGSAARRASPSSSSSRRRRASASTRSSPTTTSSSTGREVPAEQIKRTDVTPDNFGRIAAQTAKQVIQQRIREAERAIMYEEYVDRQGEVVTGIVQQAGDRNNVLVDLGRVEALLPRSEQVDGERVRAGEPHQGRHRRGALRHEGTAGHPLAPRSGAHPRALRARGAARSPTASSRSAGSPASRATARRSRSSRTRQGVDPVGACVGPRGSRVRMVVSELRGEKIDIIPWNTEPARFVAKALSPARVREVYIDDETQRGDRRRPRTTSSRWRSARKG